MVGNHNLSHLSDLIGFGFPAFCGLHGYQLLNSLSVKDSVTSFVTLGESELVKQSAKFGESKIFVVSAIEQFFFELLPFCHRASARQK
jgi:hypothetical protein